MKTRNHHLNAFAAGVALAMGSLPVIAQPPVVNPVGTSVRAIMAVEKAATAPSFNRAEQTGLCLIESVVSLLAARTNDFGCAKRVYDLAVFTTDNDGVGQAEIAYGVDEGGTTLNATLSPAVSIGTRCKVDEAEGMNLLSGVPVVDYDGIHGWNRTNEIFYSNAKIDLRNPQTKTIINYTEAKIKDYFKQVLNGKAWEFGWGLENINKFRDASTETNTPDFYYPVQKWQNLSWYTHENGGEGQLHVRKFQMIPRSASACKIYLEVPEGGIFNGSGEFEATGTVTVGPSLFL